MQSNMTQPGRSRKNVVDIHIYIHTYIHTYMKENGRFYCAVKQWREVGSAYTAASVCMKYVVVFVSFSNMNIC